MKRTAPRTMRVCESVDVENIPILETAAFGKTIVTEVSGGGRVIALFGVPADSGALRLFAVLSDDASGRLAAVSCFVNDSFPSLTPQCPQVHLFEREIFETYHVTPSGHPWLKPVRFPKSPVTPAPAIGEADFFTIAGEEIHEVAVGPVHAGVIEPGHFRFQCHGENVLHLEISLGYQHRGIERALVGAPNMTTLPMMEAVAGDTTIGHTTAYCQLLEALSGCEVSVRAQALRGIALELERCANHTGDIGALSADVGYLPTASFCGRLRGDFLNLSALLCGSRFGRGFLRKGGTAFDIDDTMAKAIVKKLSSVRNDLTSAVELLFSESTVMSRFEKTGALSTDECRALGIVGVAARASDLVRDVRCDFPTGIYKLAQIPVVNTSSGDVFARAFVRWRELQCSIAFIVEQVDSLARGAMVKPARASKPKSFVVSLVEGWRGEVCHCAITDKNGAFACYKIVDPSFHNWSGLALALRNQQISDFPLCNKSFNLSYCGFDL
jgi:Ni,Fe-hydrogenase III large subunit